MQTVQTRRRFKSTFQTPKEEKHTNVVSFKLSSTDIEKLNQEADKRNWTKAEVIRRSLNLYFDKA